MTKQSILNADLLIFARYLFNLPAVDRVAAARAVIAEAQVNREPGGNMYRASIAQICHPANERAPAKAMNLRDRDAINAYEAALIALDEYARAVEGLEVAV